MVSEIIGGFFVKDGGAHWAVPYRFSMDGPSSRAQEDHGGRPVIMNDHQRLLLYRILKAIQYVACNKDSVPRAPNRAESPALNAKGGGVFSRSGFGPARLFEMRLQKSLQAILASLNYWYKHN